MSKLCADNSERAAEATILLGSLDTGKHSKVAKWRAFLSYTQLYWELRARAYQAEALKGNAMGNAIAAAVRARALVKPILAAWTAYLKERPKTPVPKQFTAHADLADATKTAEIALRRENTYVQGDAVPDDPPELAVRTRTLATLATHARTHARTASYADDTAGVRAAVGVGVVGRRRRRRRQLVFLNLRSDWVSLEFYFIH